MDILNDDVWLVIFKMLNLNERANLRLVTKKFKCLVDTIKITKLIIYIEMLPLPGQLMPTNEPFGLQDTVQVYDINKFFSNPIILDQMKPIRQLVIKGRNNRREIDLKTAFTKLSYLRLEGVVFTSASLLQSTELEHLILHYSYFNSFEKCSSNLKEIKQIAQTDYSRSPTVFSYQFNELKSRKLKYLKLSFIANEFEFLEYCFENGLFNSLEEIDTPLYDFESLTFLNNFCPTLKTINCQVGVDIKSFNHNVNVNDIKYPSQQLRDDLSVYLFGIPFNKASARPIADFISQLGTSLKIPRSVLVLVITKQSYDQIIRFERDHDLSRFYPLVKTVAISFMVNDVNFMNKFNHCEEVIFNLKESPELFFNCVDLFSRVKDVSFLTFNGGSTYGNEIFDLLPKYCGGRLMMLTIHHTNKINFEFVLGLVTLTRLNLRLCFPIEQCEFMQMIRTLKHLVFVDIAYVIESTDSKRKDELSKMKREVNDCLVNELKRPAFEFKIEIHRKKNVGTFIRYVLRDKNSKESYLMKDVDEMYRMYQYMFQ